MNEVVNKKQGTYISRERIPNDDMKIIMKVEGICFYTH